MMDKLEAHNIAANAGNLVGNGQNGVHITQYPFWKKKQWISYIVIRNPSFPRGRDDFLLF